jgi:hypothetical protein
MTWCAYKGKHCVKPMVAIAGDGSIIDIFGPNPGTDSDTVIIRNILEQYDEDFKRISKARDGGFRFAREDLEEKQYIVAMPTCPTDRKQKQLTTDEANQTRLVTKVRYKVEVVNGKLKQNRLLDRVRPNIQAHTLMADWKIAGALYNLYFKPDKDFKDDHSFIATRMKARLERKIH